MAPTVTVRLNQGEKVKRFRLVSHRLPLHEVKEYFGLKTVEDGEGVVLSADLEGLSYDTYQDDAVLDIRGECDTGDRGENPNSASQQVRAAGEAKGWIGGCLGRRMEQRNEAASRAGHEGRGSKVGEAPKGGGHLLGGRSWRGLLVSGLLVALVSWGICLLRINTPLLLEAAVHKDSGLFTKVLVASGANVHAVGEGRMTYLHEAAVSGSVTVAEVLLASGARVDAMDRDGRTALHFAAQYNNTALTQVLLRFGANMDAVDRYGWTPLHQAARYNSTAVAEVLVEAGANVHLGPIGRTPLYVAIVFDSRAVAKALLDFVTDTEATDDDGSTLLHLAACYNQAIVAQALIQKGASLDAVDKDLWTPLHWAAFKNSPEVAQVLLDSGANIEVPNFDGWTPLRMAKRYNSAGVAEMLLRKGAKEVDQQPGKWTSPQLSTIHSLEGPKLLLGRKPSARAVITDPQGPLLPSTTSDKLEIQTEYLNEERVSH